MLLRAFSSGAVALSGVEAVSNGVPAFRKPAPRNAATTLAMMAAHPRRLLLRHLACSPRSSSRSAARSDPTGISLMAEHVYGGKNVLFWVTQFATFAILILAANTAYADFPGLSSIIARDGYLPRQLANRGDRLVFSNGIIFLAVAAGILIVVFDGNISALIPLYAFGVFTGLHAQPGRHGRPPPPPPRGPAGRRRWRSTPSAASPPATVALVVVVSKFTEGAWIPAVLIPAMVVAFRLIDRHYARVRTAVQVDARLQAAAPHPPRRRARRHRQQGRAPGRAVRPVAGARPADRRLGGHRRRGAGAAGQGVGRPRHADRAAHDLARRTAT